MLTTAELLYDMHLWRVTGENWLQPVRWKKWCSAVGGILKFMKRARWADTEMPKITCNIIWGIWNKVMAEKIFWVTWRKNLFFTWLRWCFHSKFWSVIRHLETGWFFRLTRQIVHHLFMWYDGQVFPLFLFSFHRKCTKDQSLVIKAAQLKLISQISYREASSHERKTGIISRLGNATLITMCLDGDT